MDVREPPGRLCLGNGIVGLASRVRHVGDARLRGSGRCPVARAFRHGDTGRGAGTAVTAELDQQRQDRPHQPAADHPRRQDRAGQSSRASGLTGPATLDPARRHRLWSQSQRSAGSWPAWSPPSRFVANYRTRASTRDPLLRLAAICVVVILGLSRLEALYADAALDTSTWPLEGVAALADRMGATAFSRRPYDLEVHQPATSYREEAGVVPPSPAEVRAAVLQYMDFTAGTARSRVQPNIMVVLAESTFDPGATFRPPR